MPDTDFQNLSKVNVKSCKSFHLKWSEGKSFTVPDSVADILKDYTDGQGMTDLPDTICIQPKNFSFSDHRLRRAFCKEKPFQSNTPFSYQRIPAPIRDFIAKKIGRTQLKNKAKWARYPDWPLDLSCDFLEDLMQPDNGKTKREKTPVILTHDLDTAEGLENCVKRFLPLEEKYSARSVNYIVAKGWPIDHSLLEEISGRGHETGIHGYDHSNKTAFMAPSDQSRRIAEFKPLVERYSMKGYRSPSLLSTPQLLDNLSAYFSYDSSIPTSGGLFPVPNYGCASSRPFRIGNLLEIPLSLPRDGSMIFLGFNPDQIADTWIQSSESIARSGGVIVLLTHCEKRFSGNSAMLRAYEKYLQYIASGKDRYEFLRAEDLTEKYIKETESKV